MNLDWTFLDEIAATSEYSISDPVQEILSRRGIERPVEFLSPDIKHLRDPIKMKGMMAAMLVVEDAIKNNQKTRIYGDYDADGIDATTIMVLGFRHIGFEVDYYIPERHEGYGLNKDAIDKCIADGVELLITCDTGITAVEEVEYAFANGLQVIVTDHHEPQDTIPNCICINPQQTDCTYGFGELSGSGVAYQFMSALYSAYYPKETPYLLELLPFAAIGTIADVMPLIDDNRILVYYGLSMIPLSKNYGLKHLISVAGLENKSITTTDIGFKIGPIINATGRLAQNRSGHCVSPRHPVDMFLDKSRLRTYRIASELADLNKYRQEITLDFTKQVIEFIEQDPLIKKSKIMVVPVPGLPEGIVGLIAGKLKEHYGRPVLLMTNAEPGTWKGSGRSIATYDMFHELSQLRNFFEKFGGHSQACGFSIPEDNIIPLTACLNNFCQLDLKDLGQKKVIDYVIDPSLVTLEFARALQQLEPFGKGNPKPLFAFRDAEVLDARPIGKNKNHLSMRISADGIEFEGVCFSGWKKWEDAGAPPYIDVSFFPEVNEYQGRRRLQLKIDDFRDSTTDEMVAKYTS